MEQITAIKSLEKYTITLVEQNKTLKQKIKTIEQIIEFQHSRIKNLVSDQDFWKKQFENHVEDRYNMNKIICKGVEENTSRNFSLDSYKDIVDELEKYSSVKIT